MVREPIKNWLSAIFKLPVYEDFEQTKVEQSVSYDLTASQINTRFYEGYITFDLTFDVLYRCPAGFAGIGFLSVNLANTKKQIDGFKLQSVDGIEIVAYSTKTEMIISKPIHAIIKIEYDQTSEIIKQVNLGDSCNEL